MSEIKVLDSVLVPISSLQPSGWNPNEQTEAVFCGLVEEIRADGFGNPLGVVPIDPGDEGEARYRIIEGEHRYRAAIELGMVAVPCFIYAGWDETTQKLKTVRRNLLTGSLDEAKFTELVRSLDGRIDRELMPDLFGFESQDAFDRLLLPDMESGETVDELLGTDPTDTGTTERMARDSIADIVTSLFLDSCDTIDQDYMVFAYRGASISVILCGDELADRLAAFTGKIAAGDSSAADELSGMFERWLDEN